MSEKKSAELKVIPGSSIGVADTAAVRDVVLAQPICPHSRIPMIRTPDGRGFMPDPSKPNVDNCQLKGGQWWIACEKLGHDPYFRTQKTEVPEPSYELDDKGRMIKTGEIVVLYEDRRPNCTSVSPNIRHDSGTKVMRKIRDHGFKRLAEIGYDEVCQYFHCQNPVNPKYTATRIGSFCSYKHFALVAADEREEVLPHANGQTDVGAERRVQLEREEKLSRAAAPYLGPRL